jgi:hypothetical protein
MHSQRRIALLTALALAACGPSKEEERVNRLRDICRAAVSGTVRDLELTYEVTIRWASCGDTSVTTLQCGAPAADLCVLGFWLPASSDPALCEPTGCYFTCDVRASWADLYDHDADHLATICGTRWVNGQPSPGPFFNAMPWIPGVIPPP